MRYQTFPGFDRSGDVAGTGATLELRTTTPNFGESSLFASAKQRVRQVKSLMKYLTPIVCLLSWASVTHAQESTKSETRPVSKEASKQALSNQLSDWYSEASDLHDKGKLSEAWVLYQRVWRHRKTYDVATSLGGVCFQRGEYALAAHYYRIALDEMVPTASPKFVKDVEAAFERARAQATHLRVDVAQLNGKPVTELTITDQSANVDVPPPYYLEPGDRELEARVPGHEAVRLSVFAQPGATVDWKIDFDTGTSEQTGAPIMAKVRHPWVVFPIGGLVMAGLGYGVWHNADRGQTAYDAAVNLRLEPGECTAGAVSASCERAASLRQRARDAETRAWLFGGGALLAALTTGIVYWVWETEVPISVGFNPTDGSGEMRWQYAF